MYKYRSILLGCFIWSLLGCGGNSTSNPKGIQNSKSAVEYFQNKLNFTTNPNGVQGAISSHEKITIIDVRDEKSFAEEHIPGAINLPESKWKNVSAKDIQPPLV